MQAAFRRLEGRLPQPIKVSIKDSFVFRFKDQTIEAALVQKLARIISGLESALILNRAGFAQEQAVIQRILDEIGEDVVFLAYGLINDDVSELHRKYLKDFYQEDFEDFDDPVGSRSIRTPTPRRKIRAYIARAESKFLDQSRGIELHKTIHQTYSGYVHAASAQVMETYGGMPPRFHVSGMKGTPREVSSKKDLYNYFYRGLMNLMMVAMAFGETTMVDELYVVLDEIEEEFDLNVPKFGR